MNISTHTYEQGVSSALLDIFRARIKLLSRKFAAPCVFMLTLTLAMAVPLPGLAITRGTALSWGANGSCELGVGSASLFSPTAQEVAQLAGVKAMAAGSQHGLALLADGTVRAWGLDQHGQLGQGAPTGGSCVPVAVQHIGRVVAIAAGGQHSLALLADGAVLAFGSNSFGQLGDGTNIDRAIPVKVQGLTEVIAIAAGPEHSLALLADGSVRAWGRNDSGQLGDGTTIDRAKPVLVRGLSNVKAITAGEVFSLVLLSDGTVRAFGSSDVGQLGDGDASIHTATSPVVVTGLTGVEAIDSGEDHSLALLADGSVRAWGFNASGQLGDGTTNNRFTPVTVRTLFSPLSDVVALSAGGGHSLALLADGTVRAWGHNSAGELGNGSTINSAFPVPVDDLGGNGILGGIVDVIAGGTFSLALR